MDSGKVQMLSDEEIAQPTYHSMELSGSTVSLEETRKIVQQVKAERGLGSVQTADFLAQADLPEKGGRGL